jgi:hypothetical protein
LKPPWLRAKLGIGPRAVLLLLPAGLRPVKDPLFVADAVARWSARRRAAGRPAAHLVIIGPSRCAETLAAVASRVGCPPRGPGPRGSGPSSSDVGNSPGPVLYHGAVPFADLLAAVAEADAVVNSSVSEGMSCSIAEAMAVGSLVIARRNEGNADLLVGVHARCPPETGRPETGRVGTGRVGTGPPETGPVETGPPETGPVETGPVETGPVETGRPPPRVPRRGNERSTGDATTPGPRDGGFDGLAAGGVGGGDAGLTAHPCGYLYDAPEDFVAACVRAFETSPEEARSMTAEAKRVAHACLHPAAEAAAWRAVMDGVLGERRP